MTERRPGWWYVGWGLTEEIRRREDPEEHEFATRVEAQRFLLSTLSWVAGDLSDPAHGEQAIQAAKQLSDAPEVPRLGDSSYQVGPWSYYIQQGRQPVQIQKTG